MLELAASNIANNPAFAHAGKRIEAAYKKEAKAIGTKWPKSKLFVNSLEEKLKSVNIIMETWTRAHSRHSARGHPHTKCIAFSKTGGGGEL